MEPTEEDLKKLNQVLGYLSKHSKRALWWFKRGRKVNFEAFIDASFGLHGDRTRMMKVCLVDKYILHFMFSYSLQMVMTWELWFFLW